MTKRELGDVATRLLLENHKVKIWELNLEPGQASDWHQHSMDYITVTLEGSHMQVDYDDGTSKETDPKPGKWRFAESQSVHQASNIGDTRYRNILIELKN
jgi:quercetin dioxygenase-like cupin family protein